MSIKRVERHFIELKCLYETQKDVKRVGRKSAEKKSTDISSAAVASATLALAILCHHRKCTFKLFFEMCAVVALMLEFNLECGREPKVLNNGLKIQKN